eukprot:Skav202213  [mRNA]  locus=scaffold5327:83029:88780:- [translate_table: standard]
MEALKNSDSKSKKKSKKEKKAKAVSKGFSVVKCEEGTSEPSARKSIQEIRYYQSNTELLIPKLSFQKLVRDICQQEMGPLVLQAEPVQREQQGEGYQTLFMFLISN